MRVVGCREATSTASARSVHSIRSYLLARLGERPIGDEPLAVRHPHARALAGGTQPGSVDEEPARTHLLDPALQRLVHLFGGFAEAVLLDVMNQ